MKKKLYELMKVKEIDMLEQLFRVIVMVGAVTTLVAVVEELLINGATMQVTPLIALAVVMVIVTYETFRKHRVSLSAVILEIAMVGVAFPLMFLRSGGVEGGSAIWFVLGFFYTFMVFSGWRLWLFTAYNIIIDAIVYIYGYYHPETIISFDSKRDIFVDSFFAVVVVGCICGIIMQYQIAQYKKESRLVKQQKEELEKANEAQNAFFSSMSHEIRTPLNSVIGLNEMILRSTKDDGIRRYSEYINNSSKLLLELLNDILDISQIKQNRMEIVPVEYHPEEMLRNLISMMQIRMMEKNLDFIIDIDEKIPSVLFGDEKRIEQVILNILTNAVKYTNEGRVEFIVRAEKFEGDEVQISIMVWDTGIGIRKEDLATIYDAFRRLDSSKNAKVEGSGLGLAITKQLVNMMGGKITVDSIYTRGTNFAVILNQKVIDRTPIGKVDFLNRTDAQADGYERSFEAPEARVLIIEDNEMNTFVLRELLSATKVQIDVAEDGHGCLEKTRQKYYDVILMDYMLPDMSGAETLASLRRQENSLCRETPVILFTASGAAQAEQIAKDNGFSSYLVKPVDAARLEAELLRFLPEDVIEYRRKTKAHSKGEERGAAFHKEKKRIYITTDCVCDLPDELLEKYDIRMKNLYVCTDCGRFADRKEIDSDEISQYLSADGTTARADSGTLEEYEQFFADAITDAENVIHISMASRAGKSYGLAAAAAESFDHVHVIDSHHVSAGEGLLVLHAAHMAKQNYSVEEILVTLDRVSRHVEAKYMLPDVRTFAQKGFANRFTAGLYEFFHLHPVLRMKNSRPVVFGAVAGNTEYAWRHFIRRQFYNKRRINTDIVCITYVGINAEQQEAIKNEILKNVSFEEVIMQKAALSLACSVGAYVIGISYFRNDAS